MKILIEEHTQEYVLQADGEKRIEKFYRVRYKLGWWWPWRYVQRQYSHSDPEVKDFKTEAEAVRVAQALRMEHQGPKHTVQLLDENGGKINHMRGD